MNVLSGWQLVAFETYLVARAEMGHSQAMRGRRGGIAVYEDYYALRWQVSAYWSAIAEAILTGRYGYPKRSDYLRLLRADMKKAKRLLAIEESC